jgi:hypothetical protein
MTQEEKAKAYDDLLVKLQKAKVDNNVCDERYCCVIDDIVPELIEIEDERIRKNCIDFLELQKQHHAATFEIEECIAWLEKQGEQKPAWSEEDERIRIETIELLETANHPNVLHRNGKPLDFTENINWLKSLRPQNTWKPSDEQIKAIRLARSFVVDDFGEHPMLSETLMELEEQLKKLNEGNV